MIANIAAPVVFVMPQSLRNESSCSLSRARGMGSGGTWGQGATDGVVLRAGKCKCRHVREIQTPDTCLEEATQTNSEQLLRFANCPPIGLSLSLHCLHCAVYNLKALLVFVVYGQRGAWGLRWLFLVPGAFLCRVCMLPKLHVPQGADCVIHLLW